jgi:Ca-activated chloride channel family protein
MKRYAFFLTSGIITIILATCNLPLAFAQGIIVPRVPGNSGLELTKHVIDAEMHENIAVVNVEQEFYNNSSATVEGDFYFPLPKEAQVSKFAMIVDGKTMTGEMLPQEEARRIYEDIVRRMMDPALLEMADSRWFRARLFPVPSRAKRTIKLRFDATLSRSGNAVQFDYPLHGQLTSRGNFVAPMPLPRPQEESMRPVRRPDPVATRISVKLNSAAAIKNIYSPTHKIDVDRRDDEHATVECSANADGNSTFQLYYSLDAADLGMTMLTYRPRSDEPGYFLLLASPGFEAEAKTETAKDVVFVLDCSGSMAGEKMTQARNALRFCLQRLGPDDRFGIVDFSSNARLFAPQLRQRRQSVQDALGYVDRLEASGGTNINEALLAGLDLLRGSDHATIIFLTDGLPTSGVTDEGEIRRNVKRVNRAGLRLYTFGVGYDVNTRLLDGLAKENAAFADYIAPQENIEERVSGFYEKISHPAMTDLKCSLDGVSVTSMHPAKLPDLFRNDQLTLFGRYTTTGKSTVAMTGKLGEARREFIQAVNFPERAEENDFIARLWATRRVGDLLEEIRLHGENQELKKEIETLATQYGIVTPYTSYLVQEDEAKLSAAESPAPMLMMDRAAASGAAMQATSGEAAVNFSKSVSRLKEAEVVEAKPATLRVIRGVKMQQQNDGAWRDVSFKDGDKTLKIAFASPAYFSLIKLYPEAKEFCKLGQKVIFKYRGVFVQIDRDGAQQMSEAEFRKAFGS